MSLGFHSEFQLGLQSILAADDREGPALPCPTQEDADTLFELMEDAAAGHEGLEGPSEGDSRDSSVCRLLSPQECCREDSRTHEQLSSSRDRYRDRDRDGSQGLSSRDGNHSKGLSGLRDPPHRQMVSRFQKLKAIRHPHLCSYTNVLRMQGRIYLVSEHWSLSLQDILNAWDEDGTAPQEPSSSPGADAAAGDRRTRWNVKKLEFLGSVTAQTLTALAYLNSLGLSHSRLEPRTIRIDAQGNVRLSEWGLCYLTDGGQLAPSADLLSPFAFLAPEQVLGGPAALLGGRPCSKHDVWALGMILLRTLQPRWSAVSALNEANPQTAKASVDGPLAQLQGGGSTALGALEEEEEREGSEGPQEEALQSLNEDLEKVIQLVLYCAVGVDCRVLLPLDPPSEGTETPGAHSAAAPTLSAIGTALLQWLLSQVPLLDIMMRKATGRPCQLLRPESLSTLAALGVLRAPLTVKPQSSRSASDDCDHRQAFLFWQNPPEASRAAAFSSAGGTETIFFRSCLEGFTRWLSGSALCQRRHFSSSVGHRDGGLCEETNPELERQMQQVHELLRACLILHPSARPAARDLLAFEWLQKAQRGEQLWCSRGSECIGLIAELHVDEELKRIFSDLQPQGEDPPAARAVPWLPFSRIGRSNNLDLLLRNHNIGLDEIFYWWQLQGGDVHAALLSLDAFQPVPPVFSLPLCCLRLQQDGTAEEGGLPLTRIEFLSAFADAWVHSGSKKGTCCNCLTHRTASDSSAPSSSESSIGGKPSQGGEGQTTRSQQKGQGEKQTPPETSAALQDPWKLSETEAEDSFFLTGFTGDRNWRDVRLWKEGDVRVFGASVDETVKAIQEADRFPVTQMSEVRPPCLYRRQCHFLYQRLRVRLFKSLLAQLPKSRHRLMEEAACDIPPLLRPEIWAAVMGINLVGVLHTTQLAYEEAASSFGSLALEALQTSEFSQYHEYHDLLGSEDGRRRLLTLVGVVLQRNPMYVCVRGMDALAAPLLLLYYHQENVALACLEKLLQDFQQHLFAADSASFLRRQLAASNRLLLFVDPELALHLHKLGLHSDMYAMSWHLTLFSHVLPLQQLLLLWDTLLLQPPTFVHFLTVCILHFLRLPLLSLSPDEESTAIRLLQASFEFINIPALCAAAVALQNAVPWSLALLPSLMPKSDIFVEKHSASLSADESSPQQKVESSGDPPTAPSPMQGKSADGKDAVSGGAQSQNIDANHGELALNEQPVEAQKFFIGEEMSPRSSDSPQHTSAKPESDDVRAGVSPSRGSSSISGSSKQESSKKSSSWRTRAIMSVMKGPALMLLGAPRKPNTAKSLAAEEEGEGSSFADPMDVLYSSEPIALRWWDKMDEQMFLKKTSPVWSAAVDAESLEGMIHEAEQALQPPCVGVDVLLHFHEESAVLDIRPLPAFESIHFTKAVHVTPKDVDELIILLREGQAALPNAKGVLQQIQKLGSIRPRMTKITRASTASSLDTLHQASDSASSMGLASSEAPEGTQARGLQGPAAPALHPWVSADMKRLPLIVVMGDKEDSGSGFARRLLMAGISSVCVLLGGIEALQFDAPYDFLEGKNVK